MKFVPNSPSRLAALAIAGLGLAAIATMPAASQTAERKLAEMPLPVMHVTGEGRISVAPDMAEIQIGVVREAETASEALKANNEAMAAIIAAMKEGGIADKDLQTSSFSIQPKYYYPPQKSSGESQEPRIVGYTVSNNLTIRVRELAKTGEFLDQVVSLGANSGGNIAFTNADTAAIITQARAAAMADAKNRAHTLAGAASITLGNILEISESGSRPGPIPLSRGKVFAEAMARDAVPVEGGESTYAVNVSVTFEIRQ